jgi:hypothetical protein
MVQHYSQVPQGAYSVVAEVRAKPGREAELRAAAVPLVALVRSDPKNLLYFLQEDREARNAMPSVKIWFAKLPELSDGGVKVMRMEILNGPHG